MRNRLAISVIVPVYNVEEYLRECVDSLLNQDIPMEIILVNDGSTDSSGDIVDSYQRGDNRVKVIHQVNRGLSSARNTGLTHAKGEYAVFIDSDDWLEKDSLAMMYKQAKDTDADMLVGGIRFCYPDGNNFEPFKLIQEEYKDKTMNGKDWFSGLFSEGIYYLMVCNYMYKREWLVEEKLTFEKVIHEDELWTPVALSKAKKVTVTNNTFYNYRQRDGSIMHSLENTDRLKSLLYIANTLAVYTQNYTFENDREFKSWLWTDILRLYSITFGIMGKIKDSSYVLPKHYLYVFPKMYCKLDKHARNVSKPFYSSAKYKLRKYLTYRITQWFTLKNIIPGPEKKLILVYNTMWDEPLPVKIEDIPDNYIITTDHYYLKKADAVVFHMPTLYESLNDDLDKPDSQLWVAWNMECEENYPWMKDREIHDLFDIRMDYFSDADIVYPYYRGIKANSIPKAIDLRKKKDKTCMMVSSLFNQSRRQEYLKELMRYTKIDSYGRLYNNKPLENDRGRDTKMELYSGYRFVIAFENAIGKDYVTEKFYDPLLAGSVPVYLGAPNIEEFAPGDNCFVDVRNYRSPEELADYLNLCMSDDREYMKYHQWRGLPFRKSFADMEKVQDTNPFIRLCELLDTKYFGNMQIKQEDTNIELL